MPLLVSLRSNFVAKGVRYRAHPEGTVIPDELKDILPSSAQIMKEYEDEAPPPPRFRRKVQATGAAPVKPKPKASSKDEAETLSQLGDKGPA